MKGLFVKDLRLMLIQKRFFLMIIVFSLFFVISDYGASFIISYMTFLGSLFSISSMSYDEFNNGLAFLMTLPILRQDYVQEKYLFALFTSMISWLFSLLLAFLYQWIMKQTCLSFEDLMGAVTIYGIWLLIVSLMIPIQLKYGSEKGRIAQILICGMLFMGVVLIIKFAKYIPIDFSNFILFVSQLSMPMVLFIVFVFVVLMMWISYRISVKIMLKKEF